MLLMYRLFEVFCEASFSIELARSNVWLTPRITVEVFSKKEEITKCHLHTPPKKTTSYFLISLQLRNLVEFVQPGQLSFPLVFEVFFLRISLCVPIPRQTGSFCVFSPLKLINHLYCATWHRFSVRASHCSFQLNITKRVQPELPSPSWLQAQPFCFVPKVVGGGGRERGMFGDPIVGISLETLLNI